MARALWGTATEGQVADPLPEIPKVCRTCVHWRIKVNAPFIGDCDASRAGMGSPLITTDLMRCSYWQWRDA